MGLLDRLFGLAKNNENDLLGKPALPDFDAERRRPALADQK